ncbi:uncharacterized protein LOC116848497 [Odontomachus brunneus]|uniref:uncharacterized protein LOC116848497 n=1 Tax=Odontomachus brunneus TaxID=486640 RepID=UPI0013F181AF|nr:uncharacterized protein LOC116848497 [Odontomachus brunneus]
MTHAESYFCSHHRYKNEKHFICTLNKLQLNFYNMKTIYSFVFIAVIGTLTLAESGIRLQGSQQNYQSGHQRGFYDNTQAKYYKANPKLVETTASGKLNLPLSQKMNVSAWGIIAIVLGVIIFSTITYYVFILYPYICKKEQSYDTMELTDVNSVCTVSDTPNMPLYNPNNIAGYVSVIR